jgi:hypothetical protein
MSKDLGKKELPSVLVEASRDLVARPKDVVTVDVVVDLGEAFDDYISEYHRFADSTLHAHGGELNVTLAELSAYVRTLIYSRINYVRRDRYVVHPTTRLVVPTLVSSALASLGEVKADEFGVILRPIAPATEVVLLDKEEMQSISNRLEVLTHFGFTLAIGFERDRRGSLDLMVMQYLANEVPAGVYSHTRSPHPAYALVAYFLGLKQLTSLFGNRIVYGRRDDLLAHLRGLAVA